MVWFGADRARLTADLVHELDVFAEVDPQPTRSTPRTEQNFVVELAADPSGPELERRLLLGQELGFSDRGTPFGDTYRSLGALHRLRETSVLDPDGPAVSLVRGLTVARDAWSRRLAAAPPGGVVAPAAVATTSAADDGAARPWWRREGKDPLAGVRAKVKAHVAATGSGRVVLAGPFGTGRTEVLLGGLATTAAGRRASIWCPDTTTAVRLHLAARSVDRRWQPRLHVWHPDDPLPQWGTAAPGEQPLLAVAELQRFPRQVGFLARKPDARAGS